MGGKPRPKTTLTDEEIFHELIRRGYMIEVPGGKKEMYFNQETGIMFPRQKYIIMVPESSFMFDKEW
jgi:hypothetical protein